MHACCTTKMCTFQLSQAKNKESLARKQKMKHSAAVIRETKDVLMEFRCSPCVAILLLLGLSLLCPLAGEAGVCFPILLCMNLYS